MIIIKQLRKILVSIVVAYVPSLFIIAALIGGEEAFFDTPFIFDLLIVLLYTFPIVVGTIEVLLNLERIAENKKHFSVYNIITMVISLSVIVITVALSKFIYVSITLAVVLLMLEIIHCAKKRTIINLVDFLKQPSFWIIVFCILLSITFCSGAYRLALNSKDQADPLDFVSKNSDNIEELEKQISNKYELANFKLVRVTIAIVDNVSSEHQLIVEGTYTQKAKVELWTQRYKITQEDFALFYELHNNEVVYNSEKNMGYDLIMDVTSEIISTISNIILYQ